jgi:hypothetical protein
VARRRCAAKVVDVLRGLAYDHHGQGGVPGREYLTGRPAHGPAINVHVFAFSNSFLDDNRMIRDYLQAHPTAARASVVVVEDVAQLAREGFGLAGVSELAAQEAAVVAGEHGRLLTEQFGGGHRRAAGEGARGLLAHGDHDSRGRRGQRVDVGVIAADRPRPVR